MKIKSTNTTAQRQEHNPSKVPAAATPEQNDIVLLPFGSNNRRCRSQQLFNRTLHRPVHLRYNSGHIALVNCSYLGDSVAPHCRTVRKVHHLSGDCDFNFDAASSIKFLEIFEASAKNV